MALVETRSIYILRFATLWFEERFYIKFSLVRLKLSWIRLDAKRRDYVLTLSSFPSLNLVFN